MSLSLVGDRILGTRVEVAALIHRHPDQIRRRCQPTGTDEEGRALYDLDAAAAAFADVPRRARLTAS